MLKKADDIITKIVGGKAYNLSHLSKIPGLNVPKLVILPVNYYERYLKNGEKLSQSSQDEIQKLISGAFSDKKVAVRSSATIEDGAEASFAGMFESYMDVNPASDELFKAIEKCYKSCHSKRVAEYCKKFSIKIEPKMAIVIQEMIDADFSGVMFTANPVTNNTDEIVINIVNGAGENLVSGAENSKNFTVNLLDEIVDEDGDNSVNPPRELVAEIAKLGRKIEQSYSSQTPLDIEFSIKDGSVYILQSRPITRLNFVDKTKPRTILDNSNIIESYSGATTPLTFSFAREVYAKVYKQTLRSFYISEKTAKEVDWDLENMLAFYENKIYYRLNSWYKMTACYPGYQKNKRYMENMMGVKIPVDESGFEGNKRLLKTYAHIIHNLLHTKGNSKKFIKKFERVTDKYYNTDFSGYKNSELVKIYQKLENEILDDFTVPIFNDMATMVFFGILTDKMKKAKVEDSENIVSSLLGGRGELESVAQVTELFKIVQNIKSNPKLLEHFKTASNKELVRELKEEKLLEEIGAFLRRFGPRCANELKLETITMIEEPEKLFELIKQYLEMAKTPSGKKAETCNSEDILKSLPVTKRIALKPLLRLTKYFIKNRESLRLRRTYIFSIVRNIFLRIGENFADERIIKDSRDIFFLEKAEVFGIIKNSKKVDKKLIKEIIEKRKAEFKNNSERTIFERIYFYGEVNSENALPIFSKQETIESANILKGTGGGGEKVTGIVKFVENPDNADVRGYILMAKRTDPGWTPIFPLASAIIVERGSALSHSAVVARELGETLVVGVRGLTDRVHDGDKVTVDGINGTIEILEHRNDKK